jgi:hypothetical protein
MLSAGFLYLIIASATIVVFNGFEVYYSALPTLVILGIPIGALPVAL